MARGTTFGTLHSDRDLNLIQQHVEVEPAQPKTNYIDIPGADGSKDMTEALGVGVKYKDRAITWTFALYPGDNWSNRQRLVSNALNGKACDIILDEDPEYYYKGRLAVSNHKSDGMLKQITVKAVCRPYKLKQQPTTVSRDDLTANYKALTLENDRKPAVPSITVSAETTLSFNGNTYTVGPGEHVLPEIQLAEGVNTLKAKLTAAESGSISVAYQEGAL